MPYIIEKRPTATINLTVDEWELFTGLPGAKKAAAELNKAAEEAINTSTSADEAREKAEVTFNAYANLAAFQQFDHILKKAFGRI